MPKENKRQRDELARDYMIVQLKVLSAMAARMGHGQLAFLIDMASMEAESLGSVRE